MKKKTKVIPEYESPIRGIVSRVEKCEYRPLKNFEAAKKYNDAYMVMEGDSGGTIYLSIPVKLIKCNYEMLKSLLKEIDALKWNEPQDTGIYFERLRIGEGITGGDGGGLATDDLWIHECIQSYKEKIKDVLQGKNKSLHSSKFSKFITKISRVYSGKINS